MHGAVKATAWTCFFVSDRTSNMGLADKGAMHTLTEMAGYDLNKPFLVQDMIPDASTSFRVFARRGSKMLGWWVRGLGRPTPFFDERAKAPLAVPRVLTPSERAAADANWGD